MNKVPMTETGYTRMQEELRKLKTIERPAVIRAIAEAREHGDLSENAEYHAARERQSFIEGRVLELEDKIARAEVIDVKKLNGNGVKFGFVTSECTPEMQQQAEAAGAAFFIVKPFTAERFDEVFAPILG